MNGFTTTENDAKDTGRLALEAERAHMALAEAGYPEWRVVIWMDGLRVFGPHPLPVELRARVADVAGHVRRCLPCMTLDIPDGAPRVSPDCEGTGRCEVES